MNQTTSLPETPGRPVEPAGVGCEAGIRGPGHDGIKGRGRQGLRGVLGCLARQIDIPEHGTGNGQGGGAGLLGGWGGLGWGDGHIDLAGLSVNLCLAMFHWKGKTAVAPVHLPMNRNARPG